MDSNFVNDVLDLYSSKNWREILDRYHDYDERNKLLWVYPSEDNLIFLSNCVKELQCDSILSIGCGCGLLEWIINQATGTPVAGVEVDSAWWGCKYAPPTFIPLLFTQPTLDKKVKDVLKDSDSKALLFCYFNNRPAFEEYLEYYSGNVIVIIGPDNKGVHTDPGPFGSMRDPWKLYKWEEVRNSRDFIAIYYKDQ